MIVASIHQISVKRPVASQEWIHDTDPPYGLVMLDKADEDLEFIGGATQTI